MSKRRNHDAAFKARLRDRNPKGSGRMACMHPRYHPRAGGDARSSPDCPGIG